MKNHDNNASMIMAVTLLLMPMTAAAGSAAPSLDYSTYLGAAGTDSAGDIARDSQGNLVLCGYSNSLLLATPGAAQTVNAGGDDVFVSKISADGSAVLFTTYFGGDGLDRCNRIRLAADDSIVITGYTESTNLPTPGGFDTTYAGGGFGSDAYVAKLAADGSSLVFATYLGGQDLSGENPDIDPRIGRETARGLHIDGSGNIFVVGNTSAADFPATHQLSGRVCGDDTPFVGSVFVTDQFITKLTPAGNVVFSTCLGGTARDTGRGVTLLPNGDIVTIGHTRSSDYPVTAGAVNVGSAGGFAYSAVVNILNDDATAILRAARVGGSDNDFIQDVALDDQGRIVLIGSTSSEDFPATPGAYQPSFGWQPGANQVTNVSDNIIFRLSADLATIDFATYLGGDKSDFSFAVEVDAEGQIVFLSQTASTNLNVQNPLQSTRGGDVTALRPQPMTAGAQAIVEIDITDGTDRFLIVARDGVNDVYSFNLTDTPVFEGPLGTESFDSRAVAAFDVNNDFFADILVGNYNGPNHLYINDQMGGFLPAVAFGAPASLTVGVAVDTSNFLTAQILEFNEGQQNVKYDYTAGLFAPPVPFGSPTSASVAVAPDSGFSGAFQRFVEAVAPNEIIVHDFTGGTVTSTSRTFPGIDIADVDYIESNNIGLDDLFIADRNGGVVAVLNGALSEPPVTLDTDGMPTIAVTASVFSGVTSAHDDGLRYFPYDQFAGIGPAQLVTSAAPLAAVENVDQNGLLAAGGPVAADQFASIGADDWYFGVLSPDGSTLEFGTYLGGDGGDSTSWALTLSGPGEAILAGASQAQNFPLVTPLQASNAGDFDAVVARLRYADPDLDGDGVADDVDNCTVVSNPDQRDTNADGYGNICDADLDDNCIVNAADLGIFKAAFFGTGPDEDFNGDGVVNAGDLGVIKSLFFDPPGPGLGSCP